MLDRDFATVSRLSTIPTPGREGSTTFVSAIGSIEHPNAPEKPSHVRAHSEAVFTLTPNVENPEFCDMVYGISYDGKGYLPNVVSNNIAFTLPLLLTHIIELIKKNPDKVKEINKFYIEEMEITIKEHNNKPQ
jgi:hypothetical protein